MNLNSLGKFIKKSDFISKDLIKKEVISVIGYGPQARNQSLNLIDRGISVNIGVRKNGDSWFKAQNDGFIVNKNLFDIEEAVYKGTIIQYLLSDKGQMEQWLNVKNNLLDGNTLYFSHGFNIVYQNQTNVIPPKNIDVIMIAPKGPGNKIRESFLNGHGFNSSYAIHQNYTGNALDKCLELGFAIGSNYLFETTFEKETFSDLTGERCVLMGMIQGALKAQYDVLIENGHSQVEAYNETVEEGLRFLYPMINEKGMDWMYENCSTTAQIGALDWANKFEKILKPEIKKCYLSVSSGEETKKVLNENREKTKQELKKITNQELWKIHNIMKNL